MTTTKRVLLANGSRLLGETLQHALRKAGEIEVVQEMPDWKDLPAALQRFHPQWVVITRPYEEPVRGRIDSCAGRHPGSGFVFVSPNRNHILLKRQSRLQEIAALSLHDFVQLLERDHGLS